MYVYIALGPVWYVSSYPSVKTGEEQEHTHRSRKQPNSSL